MAKRTIRKEVYVCDRCGRLVDGPYFLEECPVCHRNVCSRCNDSLLVGRFHQMVCKDCRDREDVSKIIEEYTKEQFLLYKKFLTKLKRKKKKNVKK